MLRTRQKSFTLAFDRSGPFLIVNYRSLGLSSGIGLVALDPGVQASKRKGGKILIRFGDYNMFLKRPPKDRLSKYDWETTSEKGNRRNQASIVPW